MSFYKKEQAEDSAGSTGAKLEKIQVTMTSSNVPALEKACVELVGSAKMSEVKVKGPIRYPTKTLRITCRKTPCGEGSKTWDHFEMRIHKRVVRLVTTMDELKELTKLPIDPVVNIYVTVN